MCLLCSAPPAPNRLAVKHASPPSLVPGRTGALLLLLAAGCGGHPPGAPSTVADAPRSTTATVPTPLPNQPTTPMDDPATRTEVATLGAGCFWCIEATLERIDGVLDVTSGYMGGELEHPTYQQVCTGATGHAEVVQVTFDPSRLDYRGLLHWFFKLHDPTTIDRQGNDEGPQYRSAIFTHTEQQAATAKAVIAELQPKFGGRIVTEVTPASRFWVAEDYHQDYFRKNPNNAYCRAMILPKLDKHGLGR